MPFSVIVSLNETTVAGRMYACCSIAGKGGASNEVHIVLFACVLPSYSSIAAEKQTKNRFLHVNGLLIFQIFLWKSLLKISLLSSVRRTLSL